MILVLDYGSQTTQLIARRIREKQVYSEIVPCHSSLSGYKERAEGIILSGGPSSVYSGQAPRLPMEILSWNVPILGICYGAQLLVHALGGKVEEAGAREFGSAQVEVAQEDPFFAGLGAGSPWTVWMSHGDRIVQLPPSFEVIARSANSPFAAIRCSTRRWYGVQFHPEVSHTEKGELLLENFALRVCQAKAKWRMEDFISDQITRVQNQVGSDRVICGLSGGVDSSVVTLLLHRALGHQVTPIFVDTGLLRQNERVNVEREFRDHFEVDLRVVDASSRFLKALRGVEHPEEKRKIIGGLFVEVFEEEARSISGVKYLAQGTLYPDVIESTSFRGPSAKIKTHHNVGGLPARMNLSLLEPLRELFKDEVRELGRKLGLPEPIVRRHPFPGPGLAVRILGEVTPDRVQMLRAADAIFVEELRSANLYDEVWQALVVLLSVQSVGVMGDGRTYESVCALRAVKSVDGMTADWAQLPHGFLGRCANRIINEIRGINRVVYDISSKPPATIEWE